MTVLTRSPYFDMKQILMRRVFAYAAAAEAFGLVAEFGRRFNTAIENREAGRNGCLVPLNAFMKAVSNPPPIDEEGEARMDTLVMSMCKGQPQAIRALNIIALRDERLHGTGGWRDASNDPPGNNPRL